MGCTTSKDVKKVITRMEQQDKKIQDLIHMNHALQQKLGDLQTHSRTEGKVSTETNDLTNMLDARFTKLEKTVEKIHNQFKTELFKGIPDHHEMEKESEKFEKSLSLNFANEPGTQRTSSARAHNNGDPQWKDLLEDSDMSRSRLARVQSQSQQNEGLKFVKPNSMARPKRSSLNPNLQNMANHNEIRLELR